jgi:hypothetical protein
MVKCQECDADLFKSVQTARALASVRDAACVSVNVDDTASPESRERDSPDARAQVTMYRSSV